MAHLDPEELTELASGGGGTIRRLHRHNTIMGGGGHGGHGGGDSGHGDDDDDDDDHDERPPPVRMLASTRRELVAVLKEWVKNEKDMAALSRELRQRREHKKELSSSLLHIMKTNNIDCFDISDGKVLYSQTKTKKPINRDHIVSCFEQYFADNPHIRSHAEGMTKYILENREVVVRDNIKLKMKK